MQPNLRKTFEVLPAETHIHLLIAGNTLIAFGKGFVQYLPPLF
jgi:hypothetical protein